MPEDQPTTEPTAVDVTPAGKSRRFGRFGRFGRSGGAGGLTRHPVLTVILASMLVVAVLTSAAVTLIYRDLDGNVQTISAAFGAGYKSPDKVYVDAPHQPLNILVMGSDSRDCAGCKIDNEAGGGSDTTLLIHLSADRKNAYGISVPRDLIVDRPACADKDGNQYPAEDGVQWNAAYSMAGPGCTIEEFEQLSNVHVDDYIVVNFAGFKDMVDAVGGVEVCIPQTIVDTIGHITLPAGTRTISGNEALSYVRVRHGVGDGSDLGRIKRQQAFIASMAHAVLSAKTLANPWRVYKFLKATTSAIQFNEGLGNLQELGKLGYGFRGIGLDKIKFLTMPVAPDPEDPNRVIPGDAAPRLWKLINKDKPLPAGLTSTAIKAGAVPGQKKHHSGTKTDDQTSELQSVGLCT